MPVTPKKSSSKIRTNLSTFPHPIGLQISTMPLVLGKFSGLSRWMDVQWTAWMEREGKRAESVRADGKAEPLGGVGAMLYPGIEISNNGLLSFPPVVYLQTMLSHLFNLLCVSLAVMTVRGPTLRCRLFPREPGPGNGSAIGALDLSITPYCKQYGTLRSALEICE